MQRAPPRNLYLTLILIGLTACHEPFCFVAGGRLSGAEAPLVELPNASGVMQLETLPNEPYSVNVGYTLLEGQIYLDPAKERHWYQNILSDPNVRIRFDGANTVHPMLSIRVSDPTLLGQFDPERISLRLESRVQVNGCKPGRSNGTSSQGKHPLVLNSLML
ncbi:MAG: hypothetical protein HOJ61_09775, partial [Gammaproteobacteria bacterium]|nr:hypothetical protein [Gammaproteobacteria bacterium]